MTRSDLLIPAHPLHLSDRTRRRIAASGLFFLGTAMTVGVTCDTSGSHAHLKPLSVDLMAQHRPQISETELRQARQVALSRSSDQRLVRYQHVQVRRDQARAERLRQEARERQQAAERHRLAAERALAAWRAPLQSYAVTAGFGQSSSLWSSVHTGVDLAAPTGTSVTSVARGTVAFAAYDGAYGNKVVVTHQDGTETWYAHLDSIAVSVGQPVANTTTLGTVGSTGNVTGSHLHLELRPAGSGPVDPVSGLAARGVHL